MLSRFHLRTSGRIRCASLNATSSALRGESGGNGALESHLGGALSKYHHCLHFSRRLATTQSRPASSWTSILVGGEEAKRWMAEIERHQTFFRPRFFCLSFRVGSGISWFKSGIARRTRRRTQMKSFFPYLRKSAHSAGKGLFSKPPRSKRCSCRAYKKL
jgi:hypothetical protein